MRKFILFTFIIISLCIPEISVAKEIIISKGSNVIGAAKGFIVNIYNDSDGGCCTNDEEILNRVKLKLMQSNLTCKTGKNITSTKVDKPFLDITIFAGRTESRLCYGMYEIEVSFHTPTSMLTSENDLVKSFNKVQIYSDMGILIKSDNANTMLLNTIDTMMDKLLVKLFEARQAENIKP